MQRPMILFLASILPVAAGFAACGRGDDSPLEAPELLTNTAAPNPAQADQLREVRDFYKLRREAITQVRTRLGKATNAALAAAVVDDYLPELDALLAFTLRMRKDFPDFELETEPALAIDNERLRKLENDLATDFIKARRTWITNEVFGEALERWRRHALRLAPKFLEKE